MKMSIKSRFHCISKNWLFLERMWKKNIGTPNLSAMQSWFYNKYTLNIWFNIRDIVPLPNLKIDINLILLILAVSNCPRCNASQGQKPFYSKLQHVTGHFKNEIIKIYGPKLGQKKDLCPICKVSQVKILRKFCDNYWRILDWRIGLEK